MAYPDPCEQCGEIHKTPKDGREACPAHILTEGPDYGRPCRHETGWGTGYAGTPNMRCKKHGGCSPPNQRKGAAYKLDQEVRRLLDVEGNIVPVEDPFTALAHVAGEILYVKDVLREKVENLESLEDAGTDKYATQIHVLMAAYERFVDRAERVTHNMSKLDLESRIARVRAAVDTSVADQVGRALAKALGSVEITNDQRNAILREFGESLRGGAPAALK